MTKIRDKSGEFAVLAAVVLTLGACSGGQNGDELATSASQAKGEIKACLSEVGRGIATDIEEVNYVVQDCLGEAYSPEAKAARTHAAVLMLTNYGARAIANYVEQTGDKEGGAKDALILKHRMEKAIAKLNAIRSAGGAAGTEAVLRQLYPNYRPLATREAGDVQLYGVLRAALSPKARSVRKTVKAYMAAATGGPGGILSEIIRRREIIFQKATSASRTLSLAKAAIFDSRCLLAAIDKTKGIDHQEKPQAIADAEEGSPEPKCPTSYPGNLDTVLWTNTNLWLTETASKLDELAENT